MSLAIIPPYKNESDKQHKQNQQKPSQIFARFLFCLHSHHNVWNGLADHKMLSPIRLYDYLYLSKTNSKNDSVPIDLDHSRLKKNEVKDGDVGKEVSD